MILLVPGTLLVLGLSLMLVDLLFIEKKSILETLVTMQFFLPKRPVGIIGNIVVILAALLLLYLSVM